jgi:hypothetical protein
VIGPVCGGCHATGAAAGGLEGLEACATGWAALVGVPSTQLATRNRVAPNDPDASWMITKLDGVQNQYDAQCAGGACGGNMPLNQPQLPAAVRDALRAWITAGATDDCPP